MVFIGDYRKAITQKYRRENEKNSKKEDKKAKGKELEQIEIKLTLTTLKLIYMKWLVKFYNHITTPEGEQVISSGWCAGGITNALKNSDTCLEPLDAFADIDPIVSEPSVEQDDSNAPNRRRPYSTSVVRRWSEFSISFFSFHKSVLN